MCAAVPPRPCYRAPKLPRDAPPLTIDGDLEKPQWRMAPWSDEFVEIRGEVDAPAGSRPADFACSTRMKMLWDETYLYVAAVLRYDDPRALSVAASFTERNAPIFQRDSDFEVFVDDMLFFIRQFLKAGEDKVDFFVRENIDRRKNHSLPAMW